MGLAADGTESKETLTPQQVLSAARLLVFQRAPYFRAGVLQLVFRESPGFGTFAATARWVVLWDPAKAVEWGVEGTAGVIVHELWHLTRDHFGRFSQPLVNQDLANIAGDLSINPGVESMGFRLPSDGLMPATFHLPVNLTAEQYYEKLQGMDVRYQYVDGGLGRGGLGVHVEVEGCGSCSGRKRADEPGEDDHEGRSEIEIRRTRITIAKAIGKHRGSVPADLSRWSDEQLQPPKVRWQEKLARACRVAVAFRPGSGHSTYSRLSRRQAGLGFGEGRPVIPSYRGTVPRATFLMDTSGSMDQSSIAKAMAEAQGVLQVCGAKMDFMVCDADVHGAREVKSIKEALGMLRGGGGSDFNPAFEQILARRPRTDVIIAATDGDISVPASAPAGVTVIWLLVQPTYGGGFRAPAPWGVAVEVE